MINIARINLHNSRKLVYLYIVYLVFIISCKESPAAKTGDPGIAPTLISYSIVKRLPHDTNSYTEGLLVHNGQLFESTGHTDSYPATRSLFGTIDANTGRINTKVEIDKAKYFGEGIVFFGNKVYQLTYTDQLGFIYDTGSYKKLGEFHYKGQGWGLTTDGRYVLMSNGSSNIMYRDPTTFAIVKTLNVADNNGPVPDINELEFIHGYIYANQWLTPYILKIDTASARVVGRIDLSALASECKKQYKRTEEMNGIAFDSAGNKIYVTGKLWPLLFEIKLNEHSTAGTDTAIGKQ